jgi:hypothetical protein
MMRRIRVTKTVEDTFFVDEAKAGQWAGEPMASDEFLVSSLVQQAHEGEGLPDWIGDRVDFESDYRVEAEVEHYCERHPGQVVNETYRKMGSVCGCWQGYKETPQGQKTLLGLALPEDQ